jgi:hypothetical protein
MHKVGIQVMLHIGGRVSNDANDHAFNVKVVVGLRGHFTRNGVSPAAQNRSSESHGATIARYTKSQ